MGRDLYADPAAAGAPVHRAKVPFLPLWLHQPVYAVALILLSMTPIDCIVGLPLVAGWAGVLTLGQAAAAVALALMAHACYSPSVLQLLAPRSAPDPGKWAEDNPQARVYRRWLLTLPILLVVDVTPALFTECQRWAAHHNADPVMLFTAICTGGCVLVTAVMRVARARWGLGDRDADDLFREVFWALLGVSLAFLPAAFRADWAPTLFGGLAVPLIMTRARISAGKAAGSQAERSAYWKPTASRQVPPDGEAVLAQRSVVRQPAESSRLSCPCSPGHGAGGTRRWRLVWSTYSPYSELRPDQQLRRRRPCWSYWPLHRGPWLEVTTEGG